MRGDLIERMREELFKYRVEIEAYKKSLNIIIICGSILLTILTFFGYNKIDNIEKYIMTETGKRLAITDSLLSTINTKKIDSLNQQLNLKEKEMKKTLDNFEKIIKANKQLEDKILSSLPANKLVDAVDKACIKKNRNDYYEIRDVEKNMLIGKPTEIYLIFNENVEIEQFKYICVKLYPKGRNIILQNKYYAINSKYNKMILEITDMFENYKEYIVEVGLIKEKNDNYEYHRSTIEVTLK